MNRKLLALMTIGVFALALIFATLTPRTAAQSDKAFENANPNAAFLRCGTKDPDDETARLIEDANQRFKEARSS
jgi:hypothetical protein